MSLSWLGAGLSGLLAVFMPVALTPAQLFADAHSGALEQLLLANCDRQALARACHWRALRTVVLLLAVLAPMVIVFGRPPVPLFFVPNILNAALASLSERVVLHGASGVLSDLATAYAAAAFGLAAFSLSSRRLPAILLGLAGAIGLCAITGLEGWALALAFPDWGLEWFWSPAPASSGDMSCEPGYSLLLGSFAAVHSVVAVLLAELALRFAARRLDRRVAD